MRNNYNDHPNFNYRQLFQLANARHVLREAKAIAEQQGPSTLFKVIDGGQLRCLSWTQTSLSSHFGGLIGSIRGLHKVNFLCPCQLAGFLCVPHPVPLLPPQHSLAFFLPYSTKLT